MRKYLIVIVILSAYNFSCKKEDNTVKPIVSENPVSDLVSESGWEITSRNNGKYELGYVFSASTNGKITHVAAQMVSPGVYTVSIWDNNSKALLLQKTVEQTTPKKFSSVNVESLAIVKDKKYVVSINNVLSNVNKDYNVVTKKGSNENIFPISRKSIVIQKSVYGNSNGNSIFPDVDYSSTNSFYGFADFTFVPD
jgi:hypothetical protein